MFAASPRTSLRMIPGSLDHLGSSASRGTGMAHLFKSIRWEGRVHETEAGCWPREAAHAADAAADACKHANTHTRQMQPLGFPGLFQLLCTTPPLPGTGCRPGCSTAACRRCCCCWWRCGSPSSGCCASTTTAPTRTPRSRTSQAQGVSARKGSGNMLRACACTPRARAPSTYARVDRVPGVELQ